MLWTMITVTVQTELEAPPHAVWRAVPTPAAFRHVTRGLIDFQPREGQTDESKPWDTGAWVAGRLRVLGVPFSQHRISIESIDHDRRVLSTNESGGPIRRWRHLIAVEAVPGDDRRSRYTDRIEIEAGVLTPLIAGFAHAFYRLRQRRWRRLAPVLAAVSTDASAWMARHEEAFNSGRWDDVLDDYTADAVLEAHVDGQRFEVAGVAAIRDALGLASQAGVQTRAARCVADDRTVAALITDESGEPYMVSFWHLAGQCIVRDVSIVLASSRSAGSPEPQQLGSIG